MENESFFKNPCINISHGIVLFFYGIYISRWPTLAYCIIERYNIFFQFVYYEDSKGYKYKISEDDIR